MVPFYRPQPRETSSVARRSPCLYTKLMTTLTLVFAGAWVLTLALLIRSLFRQAGIQDAMAETSHGAEDQLKLWEEFGQHLDEGVALINEKEQIVYANGVFAELTGWPNRSSFNQQFATVVILQDTEANPIEAPAGHGTDPLNVVSRDGRQTPVFAAKRRLHKPEGYSVMILRDASAETAEREIRHRLINLSSFELRAPVTAMKGYASMLLEGDAGKLSKDIEEYVKPILESTDNLLRIIDDMAHVEELSTDKPTASKDRVDVADYLKEMTARLSEIATQAGKKLEVEAPAKPCQLLIDKTQVARLLAMLINTASRTAEADSVVTVRAEPTERTVNFQIENIGSPLPRQSQANVFDYVGGRGLDEGIGFYVAKQIIEVHQAFVTVSTLPNGNRFILSLPRADKPTDADESKKSATPAADPAAKSES